MKQRENLETIQALTIHLLKLRNKDVKRSSHLMKKVTFSSDEYNEVRTFVADEMPSEELWFSCKELVAIKAETRKEAREWRKMEFDKLLNDAFNMNESSRDGMLSQYDPQFLINTFCALDGTLYQRGLERYCSQKLGEERSDAKSRSRYVVLDLQRQYKRNCTSGNVNFEHISKAIAAKYIENCCDAALFARRMAIGDERAITTPYSVEQIQVTLSQCRGPKQIRRLSNFSASSASSTGTSIDSRLIAMQRDDRRLSPTKREVPAHVSRKVPWQGNKELYAAIA